MEHNEFISEGWRKLTEENEKLQKQNAEYIEALKAAYPVLIEVTEQWSNGEDAYQSALDKVKSLLK